VRDRQSSDRIGSPPCVLSDRPYTILTVTSGGRLVPDPEDAATIAATLHEMLADDNQLESWGHSGQRRAHEEFLVLGELGKWLPLLASERRRRDTVS
jgi:hypothetical protein